jgi:site-specific DNA-methyltransferase (adenine-specific)
MSQNALTIASQCTVTPTGLEISGNLTEERWRAIGHSLAGVVKGLMWCVGDWLNAGERQGYLERGKLDEACKVFGYEYQSVATAASVCRNIESSRRRELLSFEHHRAVAGSADADELLSWAVETGATAKQLRAEKARRKLAELPRAISASGKHDGTPWGFQVGDCASLPFPDDSFDLVFCSPPYESQRAYDELEFCKSGQEWVDWAVVCFQECLRVSRGLVAWVVEGFTNDFAYSATPFLLLADLHRAGVKVRKPCVYQRNGIPGTGGPDWLRNDWEPIICATKNGRIPWAEPSRSMKQKPKQNKPRTATNRNKDGTRKQATYIDPEFVNPGNIIGGLVGSGGLGWKDAHKNEAPFPEWLAKFFISSFCQPGGTVLDPFSGSGTTVAVAVRLGRNGVGVDSRESQVALGETRLMGLSVAERKQKQGLLI